MSCNRPTDFGCYLEKYPETLPLDGVQIPVPTDGDQNMSALIAALKTLTDQANYPTLDVSVAPNGPNVAGVTLRWLDSEGNVITPAIPTTVWLSDHPEAYNLTTTTPSGGVAPAAGFGVTFVEHVANEYGVYQGNFGGILELSITDTSNTEYYMGVMNPSTGKVHIVHIQASDYGA